VTTDFQKNMEAVVQMRAMTRRQTPPELLGRLAQSCGNGNICVVRTAMQRPIGYFAWIRVCKESFRLIRETNGLPALYYENNEGYLPVIYDFVFLPGFEAYCKRELRGFIRRKRLVGRHRNIRFRVLASARMASSEAGG
jgi:hypothetical protein